jgi:beta-lactamase superfamily II metal-dependent hydrolase
MGDKYPLEIHFIANGHYDDAILIRTDDKTIFIDGGRIGCKTADINYLKELGVTKIDYMIGSHADYDHIQAQAYIMDTFPVERILYPIDIYTCLSTNKCENAEDVDLVLESLRRNNKVAEQVSIPSKISVGKMTLYFIAPWNLVDNNNNNNSFIFILTYGKNSFMFTGDTYTPLNSISTLTAKAQSLGLKDIDVDMLKYPHHGNNPMSDKILNATNPSMIVVPNYHASKYPTEENQNIIKNHNIAMYRQSDSTTGNITLTSDGTNIKVYMNSSASTYKR